jgi:hypothetical protein
MPTSRERATPTEMSDRLIELYVQRDEALRHDDWEAARDLQYKIDAVAVVRNQFLAGNRRR